MCAKKEGAQLYSPSFFEYAEERAEETFIVEKIVDRKVEDDGQVFYLIKWLDFSSKENTWEPAANFVHCPLLIEDFERRLTARLEQKSRRKRVSKPSEPEPPEMNAAGKGEPVPEEVPQEAPDTGFERGLEPEKILGATDSEGVPCFLIKWKGSPPIVDIVPAEEAKLKCPQTVIKFYEDKFRYQFRLSLKEMLEDGNEGRSVSNKDEEEESGSLVEEGNQRRDPFTFGQWMSQCNEEGVDEEESDEPVSQCCLI